MFCFVLFLIYLNKFEIVCMWSVLQISLQLYVSINVMTWNMVQNYSAFIIHHSIKNSNVHCTKSQHLYGCSIECSNLIRSTGRNHFITAMVAMVGSTCRFDFTIILCIELRCKLQTHRWAMSTSIIVSPVAKHIEIMTMSHVKWNFTLSSWRAYPTKINSIYFL